MQGSFAQKTQVGPAASESAVDTRILKNNIHVKCHLKFIKTFRLCKYNKREHCFRHSVF